MDTSKERFLTVEEIAKKMRVSQMTIYRLINSFELPAIKFGKSFRVPEQALNEYLNSKLLKKNNNSK